MLKRITHWVALGVVAVVIAAGSWELVAPGHPGGDHHGREWHDHD